MKAQIPSTPRAGSFEPHAGRPIGGEVLPRSRLTGALEGTAGKLVMLAAPPGFGKTTLLRQWREADDRPFAWVSLEPADNDPVLFWTRIVESLRAVAPTLESAAQIALHAARPEISGAVVPLLAHDLRFLDQDLVLVLDDYQAIDNRLCHDSLAFLLDWAPANVTVVVSTRVDPPIPVGVLRARNELVELRAVDLCFTEDEHAAYLNEMLGLRLGPATLAKLHERTEGWPAGVYLASLSLRKTDDRAEFVAGFNGSNRHVVDYLTEVALDTLDARQRDFLLATSILDSVCASLADEVTAETGSADLLDELERANLFLVALDEERRWYRYHQLFADLLRAQLSRHRVDAIPTLHCRASGWYAKEGATWQAIRHAVAAGEVSSAVDLAVERWTPQLSCARARTTRRWLDALPADAVSADPRLSLAMAWSAAMTGEPEEALRALEAARDAGLDGVMPDGTSVDAAAAVVTASFPRGDAGGMLAAARRARTVGILALAWEPLAALSLGWAEYLAGSWDAAQTSLRQAAASATEQSEWAHVAIAKALHSLAALAGGDREIAEAFAGGAREVLETHEVADAFAAGLVDLARGSVLAHTSARDAELSLERGLARLRVQGEPLLQAEALLALAPVRRALSGPKAGRECVEKAKAVLDGCADGGMLADRLERVARALTPAYRRADGDTDLTERELEVLRYLAEGLPKRDIGTALFVSYNTIHSHTKSIYQKLRVSSRDAAVARARELGALE